MPEFFASYGREAQCSAALSVMGWHNGFRCFRCASQKHSLVVQGSRQLFQCHASRHQTSLTAGTVMDSTRLPFRTFTRDAISSWAKANLLTSCGVLSDGLGFFAGAIDAGCAVSIRWTRGFVSWPRRDRSTHVTFSPTVRCHGSGDD